MEIITIILLSFVLLLAATVMRGAVFLPTFKPTVQKIVAAAGAKPGMKAVDLGAGDGRIVIALAKAGIEAHGYEINPFLVLWGKTKILQAGLKGRAFMHWGDFWGKDFSNYDIVTVFGMEHIMAKLETKLQDELKPGAKVISNIFSFPTWRGIKDEPLNIYVK